MVIEKYKSFIGLLNEEVIKNPKLVKSYLKELLKNIKKVYPNIKTSDVRYETSNPVYTKLTITINDINLSNKIKKIIEYLKKKLVRSEIILSYKEYKRNHIDIDDQLNISAKDDQYLEYVIYVKNIYVKRIKPNRYVYHYTNGEETKESILKNGLVPKRHSLSKEWSKESELEYPDAIFAMNSTDAWRNCLIFEIDTEGLKNKWWTDLNFNNRDDLIMTFESIPPDNIRLIKYSEIKK